MLSAAFSYKRKIQWLNLYDILWVYNIIYMYHQIAPANTLKINYDDVGTQEESGKVSKHGCVHAVSIGQEFTCN